MMNVVIIGVISMLEVAVVYRDAMQTTMLIAGHVGLILWPLDAQRSEIAGAITRGALDLPPEVQQMFGVTTQESEGIKGLFHDCGGKKAKMKQEGVRQIILLNEAKLQEGEDERRQREEAEARRLAPKSKSAFGPKKLIPKPKDIYKGGKKVLGPVVGPVLRNWKAYTRDALKMAAKSPMTRRFAGKVAARRGVNRGVVRILAPLGAALVAGLLNFLVAFRAMRQVRLRIQGITGATEVCDQILKGGPQPGDVIARTVEDAEDPSGYAQSYVLLDAEDEHFWREYAKLIACAVAAAIECKHGYIHLNEAALFRHVMSQVGIEETADFDTVEQAQAIEGRGRHRPQRRAARGGLRRRPARRARHRAGRQLQHLPARAGPRAERRGGRLAHDRRGAALGHLPALRGRQPAAVR